jgi:hypothetical protein
VKRAPFFAVLLILMLSALPVEAQSTPLPWLNEARAKVGAGALTPDEVLSATAALWARRLAEAAILTHRGADGSSALDRYRAAGGTDARVGEILGAGPDLSAIESGWMKSDPHRRLSLDPVWTHVGWGMASSPRGGEIWVVVFCQKLVEDLSIAATPGGVRISGRFLAAAAAARLLDGPVPVDPVSWSSADRSFLFEVAETEGYFRLGYLDPTGAFILTNAFTLPRGTGSPGG